MGTAVENRIAQVVKMVLQFLLEIEAAVIRSDGDLPAVALALRTRHLQVFSARKQVDLSIQGLLASQGRDQCTIRYPKFSSQFDRLHIRLSHQ